MDKNITKESVYNALSNVYDPELGLPITDLGLVYRVEIKDKKIEIDFTLTYPGCPLEDVIKESIRSNVAALTQEHQLDIRLVWEPVWTPDFMSEAARFTLGYPI